MTYGKPRIENDERGRETGEVRFDVPAELVSRFASMAAREGRSLSSLYLTAYAILLSRYSANEQVTIGSLTADCMPHLTFRQLLSQISANAAQTQECAPDCDVCYVWQEAREVPESASARSFDLGLTLRGGEDSIVQCHFRYRTQMFEAGAIRRMSRHFLHLLESVASAPGIPIGDLDLMPDDERALVLGSYAGSEAEYPRVCLHELFAECAASRPGAEALVFGTERLTYRELDRRSNQVARFLLGEGLRSEEPVGIFMESSADMMVAILGILKAGGAYAPIDPKYPAERIGFMVADMAARWILTHCKVRANFPAAGTLVDVDDPDSVINGVTDEPVSPSTKQATPDSIAALIYTSGSMGGPKGALIPHRAVVRAIRNTNYLQVKPEDRVAQVMSPSFDVCILEVWSALANGATLIGVPRDTLLVPNEMAKTLRAERISILCLPTAYLNQIGREAPDILKDVRVVLFGGETAEPGPVRNILKHGPPRDLINAYGPSEAGIMTSYHKIVSVPEDSTTIPIGRPVTNIRMYLLDSRMRPVPLGLPGEICVGGEIGSGYLNRPELNRDKFIPDLVSGKPGGLLYRTGDLACLRDDGDFEFTGRIDQQVKIRGYRIEIPEVQLAVASHPDVKQAFVMVREDRPGDKRLVAYVTLERELPSPSDTLRRYLKSRLPEQMVPAAIVPMERIPLTAHGKIDRAALPWPGQRPRQRDGGAETESDLERAVARIWERVLAVEFAGLNDNFFDLGGDSLSGMRLMVALRDSFGIEPPLGHLFLSLTLREFCAGLADSEEEAERLQEIARLMADLDMPDGMEAVVRDFSGLSISLTVPRGTDY